MGCDAPRKADYHRACPPQQTQSWEIWEICARVDMGKGWGICARMPRVLGRDGESALACRGYWESALACVEMLRIWGSGCILRVHCEHISFCEQLDPVVPHVPVNTSGSQLILWYVTLVL
jgi:hypothetical protein